MLSIASIAVRNVGTPRRQLPGPPAAICERCVKDYGNVPSTVVELGYSNGGSAMIQAVLAQDRHDEGIVHRSHVALLNENTTQFFDPSRCSDSLAELFVYVATTLRQNATASGFTSAARTVQAPGRRSQRSPAAARPTPQRRNRRSTKYSAMSRTLGSLATGDPRVTSANPATSCSQRIRKANLSLEQ